MSSKRTLAFLEAFRKPVGQIVLKAITHRFGTLRDQERWGCLHRPYYAYGLLRAADLASYSGKQEVTVCEFGVARGDGLMNLIELSERIGKETGVSFRIVGFDTGTGIPAVTGYKDHPELWIEGDFEMTNREELLSRIHGRAEIVFGDIDETIDDFVATLTESAPLGFISIDVDVYGGTTSALRCLTGYPELYNPAISVYLDDVGMFVSNAWCGELAAVNEFTESHELRKIDRDRTLPGARPSGFAPWHDKMYVCHILDHPIRNYGLSRSTHDVEESLSFVEHLR